MHIQKILYQGFQHKNKQRQKHNFQFLHQLLCFYPGHHETPKNPTKSRKLKCSCAIQSVTKMGRGKGHLY